MTQIANIIRYEGGNDTFVWKHPTEDFNTATQLIVHESQEAIFFKDGIAYDVFGPGKYTLVADNLPRLRNAIASFFSSDSKVTPFHCEIFFVNKVDVLTNKWSTNKPIPIQDPLYKILLQINASGQFGIKIENSKLFMVRLFGTTKVFNKDTLNTYFNSLLLTRIKDYLAKQMAIQKVSFLEVHAHLNTISEALRVQFEHEFSVFGFKLVNFFVDTIDFPRDDVGYKNLEKALAKKAEMDVIGYSYQQEQTYDVLKTAASNEGQSGNLMGAGIGLGMGVNLGSVFGNAMGSVAPNIQTNVNANTKICRSCGAQITSDSLFCNKCGAKADGDFKTCKKCGNIVQNGSAFCNKCGNKMVDVCSNCGAELNDSSSFCSKCGAKKEDIK